MKRTLLASRLTIAGLLGASIAMPAGCSSIRSPRFEVISIEEVERRDEAVVLNFTLTADNPNDAAIPLKQADYALSLDGARVFKGSRSAEAVVQRYGKQTIVLPVVVPADRFDLALFAQPGEIDYTLSGQIEYVTPGALAELLFDTGVRRPGASLGIRGVIETGG
jgi:LEA14-like dessication related protein